jgi:hypothetical protein
MLFHLTAKEEIEVELELFKNNKYKSLIKLTDSKTFKLPKLIENSYIENKITKEEKDKYEMKLYEIIFEINTGLITLYSKKREDEIEKMRLSYLKKKSYMDNTIDLKSSYYKKIVYYICDFLYKFIDIFF